MHISLAESRNIRQKMLTQQLRQMEADNLVVRKVYPEVPPRAEYPLTEIGKGLRPILDAMHTWGDTYSKAHPQKGLGNNSKRKQESRVE